jgi:purine-cytosine permease-like protein
MNDWTNLTAVLTWVVVLGAPYLVGKLFAYLAENWSKWHTLPGTVKFVVPLVVSVLIALGAQGLLTLPEFLATVSPYWALVVQAVLAYLGSQKGYMEAKASGYGRKAQL